MTHKAHLLCLYALVAAVSSALFYQNGRLSAMGNEMRRIRQPLQITVNPVIEHMEYTNHLPGFASKK
jgi:hypothetical protein